MVATDVARALALATVPVAYWLDVRSLSGDTSSSLDHQEGSPPADAPVLELRANTVSGDVQIGRA